MLVLQLAQTQISIQNVLEHFHLEGGVGQALLSKHRLCLTNWLIAWLSEIGLLCFPPLFLCQVIVSAQLYSIYGCIHVDVAEKMDRAWSTAHFFSNLLGGGGVPGNLETTPYAPEL